MLYRERDAAREASSLLSIAFRLVSLAWLAPTSLCALRFLDGRHSDHWPARLQTALPPVPHRTLVAGFWQADLVRPNGCIFARAKIFDVCKELLAETAEAC